MKVLVVAAHPDDEVLGCGGTIAKLSKEGHDVYIVLMGEGITSRNDITPVEAKKQVEVLHANAKKASIALGAKDVFMLSFPDNRFDTVPMLQIAQAIEGLLEKIEPELVLTQHGGDLNVDHGACFRAVMTATRPMQGRSVKTLMAFEVPSSTEWAFQEFSPSFRPSVFVDVGDFMNQKLKALRHYETEMRAFPHPRSTENILALAKVRGATAGLTAAEAFQLIWEVR